MFADAFHARPVLSALKALQYQVTGKGSKKQEDEDSSVISARANKILRTPRQNISTSKQE